MDTNMHALGYAHTDACTWTMIKSQTRAHAHTDTHTHTHTHTEKLDALLM